MAAPLLTDADRDRVAAAIRAAEEKTAGEIYCVLARTSDDYLHPAALVLAAGILVASLGAALALDRLWIGIGPSTFVIIQMVAIGAGLAVLALFPGLRILLVPRSVRYRRAHANAVRQFLSHNIQATAGRTGVLVFVSLAERYAEVVADAGISAVVPQAQWDSIVAGLVSDASAGRLGEGFARAATAVGALLAEHFPPGPDDTDELENQLVEI